MGVDFRVGYGTEHLEIADDAVQVCHVYIQHLPRTRHVCHIYIQHLNLLQPGQRVFIVDDLLGSGTTMQVSEWLPKATWRCFTAVSGGVPSHRKSGRRRGVMLLRLRYARAAGASEIKLAMHRACAV